MPDRGPQETARATQGLAAFIAGLKYQDLPERVRGLLVAEIGN